MVAPLRLDIEYLRTPTFLDAASISFMPSVRFETLAKSRSQGQGLRVSGLILIVLVRRDGDCRVPPIWSFYHVRRRSVLGNLYTAISGYTLFRSGITTRYTTVGAISIRHSATPRSFHPSMTSAHHGHYALLLNETSRVAGLPAVCHQLS